MARNPRHRELAAQDEPATASDPGSAGPADTPPGRQLRRRLDTRFKLMRAALQLMAERGVDGVAIQDITNAADVGFGSFYNHFPSKEALYLALKDELVERYATSLDALGRRFPDVAEKIAASVRHTLIHGRHDPVWGRFVLRTNFNRESMRSGLGRFLLQDLMAGLAAGRFVCRDLPSLVVALGSTVMGGLMAEVEPPPQADDPLGSPADLPENVAAMVLQMLGLGWDEASAIARRPLPPAEASVNPFRNLTRD